VGQRHALNFLSLIEAKRDGRELTAGQIQEIISEFVAGRIPDYQMAAWLMAVLFQGLTPAETRALTLAMRDSGERLEFPKDPRPLVDKHSTGGVGDKVSLPLAPLLACLGFRVPMISGRGLGITGGTLDKLESIPGFKTALTREQIVAQVQEIGCVICGQTEKMVPADRLLYALRDVTGTVPAQGLITASILSKKLSESLDALVLDVKYGNAAFMDSFQNAKELAGIMAGLGNECGVKTRALVTRMNRPLGRSAGNWLEVKESVDCLEGHGPPDLDELVTACAAHLLVQTGRVKFEEVGIREARARMQSGEPRRKWDQMLAAQGADLDAFNRKLKLDHTAPVVRELTAVGTGHLVGADARAFGEVVRDLGGGRLTKEAAINHDVGADRIMAGGQLVQPGDVLCRVHAATEADADAALMRLAGGFRFSDEHMMPTPLIQRVIDGPAPAKNVKFVGGTSTVRFIRGREPGSGK
jgi:pyrimidine-nucleoside phosphorylase